MATRKILCTAASGVKSAAYFSSCSQLRRPCTTGLLLFAIGSTQSRFSAKYPFRRDDIFFGKQTHFLSYSTAAKSSPPQGASKTMEEAVQASSRCQDVIEQGKCEELNHYWSDLTELIRRGKLLPILRREDEIERCVQILSRGTKNNPIIIGEPGNEITEIVEGLAYGMVYGDVSEILVHRKLISLDTGSLLAGTKSREHFVQRLEAVLKDITASNDQIIIFINAIHALIGAGGHHADVDVGNLLNSMLGRGDFQIIGSTTWGGYNYIQYLNTDLECRFQKVLCEHRGMVLLAKYIVEIFRWGL